MSSYSRTAQNLLAQKAYSMMLNGMALTEIAKKQGVTLKTISKRIKLAEQTDYVEKVKKRMIVASADAATVYEKLLKKRGWKKLTDTEKKLQVRVSSDVLHGVGALTDEKQVPSEVAIQINVERPAIQNQNQMVVARAVQSAPESLKEAESSPNIVNIHLDNQKEVDSSEKEPISTAIEPPGLTIGGKPISEVERNEIEI